MYVRAINKCERTYTRTHAHTHALSIRNQFAAIRHSIVMLAVFHRFFCLFPSTLYQMQNKYLIFYWRQKQVVCITPSVYRHLYMRKENLIFVIRVFGMDGRLLFWYGWQLNHINFNGTTTLFPIVVDLENASVSDSCFSYSSLFCTLSSLLCLLVSSIIVFLILYPGDDTFLFLSFPG